MIFGNDGVPGSNRLRRFQIISGVSSHFVEINLNIRVPLMVKCHTVFTLPLGDGQPVTIQVMQKVIGSSPGPMLIMLSIGGIGDRRYCSIAVVVVRLSVDSVRILCRIGMV